MGPVKIAIVGIDRYADQVLNCLTRSDRLTLCAICDNRPSVLNPLRDKYDGVELYDDPREMVLRAKPNIVLLWRDRFDDEFLTSVFEGNIWLIVRPPIVGGLSTAIRMIKYSEKKGTGVYVWTPWLYLPCYQSVQDWLTGQQIRSFSCQSFNNFPQLELPAEDTLLTSSMYPYIFLSQRWLGLPEQVYCRQLQRSAQNANAENMFQYFGLANLIYPHSLGVVTVGINAGPIEEEILVAGNINQIRLNPSQARLFDCSGKHIESSHHYELEEARGIAYTRIFEQIWQSFIEKRRSNDIELKRHLGVLAILEAASLSSRTGHPEQMVKIVELNNILELTQGL
jgi:hypothetical protein